MKKVYLLIAYLLTHVAYIAAQTEITDASIEAGDTLRLVAGMDYTLDGYVYVEDGAVMMIEPGTVIKAKGTTTTGDPSSALIVSRGGQIFAEGTVDAPIIFTSDEDDLSNPEDLTPLDFQKWGGIVILGNGIVGEDGGTDFVEGIPEGDNRSQYGGMDNSDDSGVLKYVSIRHGGAVLEQDNEINGLTLGGVGSGTEIDYIEVFSGKDDGIEIFGGAVNITHAVVAYIGDDSYDFDESWEGSMQYLFSLQQNVDGEFGGDHAIEYDGSEAEDKEPKTVGRIYNATFIGAGVGSANGESDGIILKSDGAAQIWNSLILESGGYAVGVESTSIDRLAAGESAFKNNIIFGYTDLALSDEDTLLMALEAGGTENVDPQLGGISRIPNGQQLDPRPNAGSPALSGAAQDPDAADFVEDTEYRGAFDNENNWALGWTALDEYGFLGDLRTVNTKEVVENGLGMITSPNPIYTGEARIQFTLKQGSDLTVCLYDLTGRLIRSNQLGYAPAGTNNIRLNASQLLPGTYVISLVTNEGVATQKVVVSSM
ncbi:MAG: T9SS type A sorting domain-containing protein [Saprospiraceae bacterium]|nr:T9SS type A sorting domain-containing protein [Saprospiraceae bacterium]